MDSVVDERTLCRPNDATAPPKCHKPFSCLWSFASTDSHPQPPAPCRAQICRLQHTSTIQALKPAASHAQPESQAGPLQPDSQQSNPTLSPIEVPPERNFFLAGAGSVSSTRLTFTIRRRPSDRRTRVAPSGTPRTARPRDSAHRRHNGDADGGRAIADPCQGRLCG